MQNIHIPVHFNLPKYRQSNLIICFKCQFMDQSVIWHFIVKKLGVSCQKIWITIKNIQILQKYVPFLLTYMSSLSFVIKVLINIIFTPAEYLNELSTQHGVSCKVNTVLIFITSS